MNHVKGKNRGRVVLYALSTCAWCRKTRRLLTSLGVDYYFVYVDLLKDEEREDVEKTVMRVNPRLSFPTVIIDETEVIVGYDEDEIKRKLEA